MATTFDARYLEGAELFNRGAFFEAHEVWESLWHEIRDPTRSYYQGLIQAAVCLHHYSRGNLHGARKLFLSSSRYLSAYRPRHAGLDVDAFLGAMEACCRPVLQMESESARLCLNPRLLPKLHLSHDV